MAWMPDCESLFALRDDWLHQCGNMSLGRLQFFELIGKLVGNWII